jgi:glycosyltransferase involved in cell wall biosynthesis
VEARQCAELRTLSDVTHRILHIVGRLEIGGIETYLLDFIRESRNRGIESHVLSLFEKQPGSLTDAFRSLGCKTYSAHALRARSQLMQTFEKAVHEIDPSVVHSHVGEMSGDAVRALKKLGHQKVIVQTHDLGGLAPWTQTPYRLMSKNWTIKNADKIIAVTKKAGNKLTKGTKRTFEIIPPGIDVRDWQKDTHTKAAIQNELGVRTEMLLLHVGRFHPTKNQPFLLCVAKGLLETGVGVILVFVGDGETKPQVQSQADNMGISRSVRFLGARSDVADIMRAADVFLLPSKSEGLPRVLLEAASIGLPFISSRAADLSDVFENPTVLDINRPEVWIDAIRNAVVPAKPKLDISIARAVDQTLAVYDS